MTKFVVVAECGVNHQGDMDTAKKMIEKAKECQADYAKFQYYLAEEIMSEDDPRFEQIRNAQLSLDQLRELRTHCERVGIGFLATPFFSTRRVEELATIGVRKCKIREADSRKDDMIRRALELFDEVWVSTTRIPLDPFFMYHPHIKWLLTIPRYPAKAEELELDRVASFDGYSNHVPGIAAPLAAAAVAREHGKEEFSIEVHVTLDHSIQNLDQSVSIDFNELKELVRHLRIVEKMGERTDV